MNKKIAIIGGGLFGITTYIQLKRKGYECVIFEKKKDILLGASTNNLNRVHFGYHYPRDDKTAQQSYKGYLNFHKFYKKSILRNFRNYYAIALDSKISFDSFLKFCKKNLLSFKKINIEKFDIDLKRITGCIKVKEPIYDWNIIKREAKEKISKLPQNNIRKNEEIKKIIKKDKYYLTSNKGKYVFDIIIDASYEQSNQLTKNICNPKKRKYQLVAVFEFALKNFDRLGMAIMDGKFFSFLPKGKGNKHLLYHVKYSIIKQKTSKVFPFSWMKVNKNSNQINKLRHKVKLELKKYLPSLNIKLTNNVFINPRVLEYGVEKTDRRISSINELHKNYFQIFSAKVDHSVNIANDIVKKISEIC